MEIGEKDWGTPESYANLNIPWTKADGLDNILIPSGWLFEMYPILLKGKVCIAVPYII